MVMEADYLPADLEQEAIVKALVRAKASKDVAKIETAARIVVGLANKVREAYRNEEADIEKPMSTRSAIRWAMLSFRFAAVTAAEGGPMIYALPRAFSMSSDMSTAVKAYAKAVIGS
jgi:hypothetical protein